MANTTESPFVKLAVGAVRCLNPDMIAEHGPAGVRAALDLWSWRRELTEADVSQVIVTLRFKAGQQPIIDPTAAGEPTVELGRRIPPYPLDETPGSGVDGDDDPATGGVGGTTTPLVTSGGDLPAGTRTLCAGCGGPIELREHPDRDQSGWLHLGQVVDPHGAAPWPTWGETNDSNDSEGDAA